MFHYADFKMCFYLFGLVLKLVMGQTVAVTPCGELKQLVRINQQMLSRA